MPRELVCETITNISRQRIQPAPSDIWRLGKCRSTALVAVGSIIEGSGRDFAAVLAFQYSPVCIVTDDIADLAGAASKQNADERK
jgi:hypothetical protein